MESGLVDSDHRVMSGWQGGGGALYTQSDIYWSCYSSTYSPPQPSSSRKMSEWQEEGRALDNQISAQRPSQKPLIHASIALSLQFNCECASCAQFSQDWIFNNRCCIIVNPIYLQSTHSKSSSASPYLRANRSHVELEPNLIRIFWIETHS